jgi:hypothetical protein
LKKKHPTNARIFIGIDVTINYPGCYLPSVPLMQWWLLWMKFNTERKKSSKRVIP